MVDPSSTLLFSTTSPFAGSISRKTRRLPEPVDWNTFCFLPLGCRCPHEVELDPTRLVRQCARRTSSKRLLRSGPFVEVGLANLSRTLRVSRSSHVHVHSCQWSSRRRNPTASSRNSRVQPREKEKASRHRRTTIIRVCCLTEQSDARNALSK